VEVPFSKLEKMLFSVLLKPPGPKKTLNDSLVVDKSSLNPELMASKNYNEVSENPSVTESLNERLL